MKKLIALLLSVVMLCALTACGEADKKPADTTTAPAAAQDTTAAAQDTTAAVTDALEEGFVFTFQGVELVPGQAFDAAALPAAQSVYQVPSCAIEGTDNVYNYGTIEVTAFDDGNGEVIYSVYIIDANTPTNEGLYLGDTLDFIVGAYGENYVREGNQITYQKGDTMLIIIMDGDYIASIDFRWNT